MPDWAFYGHFCVKSLRAIICAAQRGLTSRYFTQQTGGLTWGITLRRMQYTTDEAGSVVTRIYWAIA